MTRSLTKNVSFFSNGMETFRLLHRSTDAKVCRLRSLKKKKTLNWSPTLIGQTWLRRKFSRACLKIRQAYYNLLDYGTRAERRPHFFKISLSQHFDNILNKTTSLGWVLRRLVLSQRRNKLLFIQLFMYLFICINLAKSQFTNLILANLKLYIYIYTLYTHNRLWQNFKQDYFFLQCHQSRTWNELRFIHLFFCINDLPQFNKKINLQT